MSQSSSQSANNPFAKGASPFSANKKGVASDPSSRNSPNPMTPVRGIRHIPLSNPLLSGGSNKSYPAAKKPVHAFSEVNSSGNASDDMTDKEKDKERSRERDKERDRERERERDGSSSGGGGSFRSRAPFNDRSPVTARNPFHSIVEESKSGIAGTSSSRSLPSSPVLFPSSPSVLSSPVAASQRIPGFDKERSGSADSSDGICHSNGAGREGVGVGGGGGVYSKYSGLFGSGSSHDITNGELTALKRRTHMGSSGNMYNGSDVGSGLDCDGDYEGDDRRGTRDVERDRDRDRGERGRHPHADRRHDISLSGRGHEIGHAHAHGQHGLGLGPGHAFNRNFSTAADDEDGEEPELDIIRPSSQAPSKFSNHAQLLNIPSLDRDRGRGGSFNNGSNSNGKPLFLKNSMDGMTANNGNGNGSSSGKTRLVHSASQSRIRPSSSIVEPSSSTRRPNTSTSESPTPRSGSHSARHPSGREDEENEGYNYRYDTSTHSQRSASQSQSQSPVPLHSNSQCSQSSSVTPVRSASHKGSSRSMMTHSSSERNIRSKSRDPTRVTPSSSSSSSVKRDIVRIGPNQSEDGEEDGSEWQCLKCGDRNVNKVHCNSCSTMRNAYSYAPGQLQQRALPK